MKSKIMFVVALLFGLMFINAGLNKFFNYMPVPPDLPEATMNDFQAMMEITWLMPLLGLAEIIGGILVVFRKTRALGVLVIFPIMVGILLNHIFVDTNGLLIAIILLIALGWMIYEDRNKFLYLLK